MTNLTIIISEAQLKMTKTEKEKFEEHYQEYLKGMEQRKKEIVKLRQQKWTLKEIGEKYEISAERVRQILLAAKTRSNTLAKSDNGQLTE